MLAKFLCSFVLIICLCGHEIGAVLPIQDIGTGSPPAPTVLLPRVNNQSSQIIVSAGIPYLSSQMATNVFVMDNGVVTFNMPFVDPPQPDDDDLTAINGQGIIMLAPYWSNVDIRSIGTVAHILFESTSVNPQVRNRITLVAEAVTNITMGNFNATWMLMVEWSGVRPFPHGDGGTPPSPYTPAYIQLVNSFQLLLISDLTSQTYAIFIYECNEVQWSGFDSVGHARIGISDGNSNVWISSLSGNATATDIDCTDATNNIVNVVLDLRDFGLAQPGPSSTVAAPIMTQTSIVPQASMTVTQAIPVATSSALPAQSSGGVVQASATATQVAASSAVVPAQTSSIVVQASMAMTQVNTVSSSAVSPPQSSAGPAQASMTMSQAASGGIMSAQTTTGMPQASMAMTPAASSGSMPQASMAMTPATSMPAQTSAGMPQASMAMTPAASSGNMPVQTSAGMAQASMTMTQANQVASSSVISPAQTTGAAAQISTAASQAQTTGAAAQTTMAVASTAGAAAQTTTAVASTAGATAQTTMAGTQANPAATTTISPAQTSGIASMATQGTVSVTQSPSSVPNGIGTGAAANTQAVAIAVPTTIVILAAIGGAIAAVTIGFLYYKKKKTAQVQPTESPVEEKN